MSIFFAFGISEKKSDFLNPELGGFRRSCAMSGLNFLYYRVRIALDADEVWIEASPYVERAIPMRAMRAGCGSIDGEIAPPEKDCEFFCAKKGLF
ncbi:MAG: hypothetical protein DBX55_08610 [Verrucomicrobia bacterium]|nr:MAG: hypothetical protein DBX55_08610 [Verrucomicrobiota bacterium]